MLNDYVCFPLFLFRRITLLVVIIFIGIISAARAQQASSEKEIPSGKSAIGIKLSVLPYDAVGTPEYRMPALDVPFIHLNYIQRLSDRANLQIGIGYGMNEAQQAGVSRHIKADSIYMKETYQHLSAVAIPFTFKWTPFNPGKRLQFYGSASFTPLYRHIKARATESLNGGSSMKTELYNRNTSSFTAVASAGITMRYRFSAKWSAYAESDFAYYNFERKYSTISLKNGAKSIGLNYNFTWKREKQEVLKSNQIEQL